MNTFIIDFETTFSNENTLTHRSIEEYVRHPKFEVIGLGVMDFTSGATEWKTGQSVRDFFVLAEKQQASIICHHAQFDLFIAKDVYGYKPAFIYDTLSMSRALYQNLPSHSLDNLIKHFGFGPPKAVPYNLFRGKAVAEIDGRLMNLIGEGCLHDVRMACRLYEMMAVNMPEGELQLIDETIRLYTEPVLIGNVPVLEDALAEAIVAREEKMYALGLTDKVLRSDTRFAVLLRGAGVEPPMKVSARTGKNAFAFARSDIAFSELLEHENPYVRDLMVARFSAKTSIHETRAGRLLGMAERGAIPVYLKWYGAHTGRPSGGDRSNMLNLTRGSKLRQGLEAPPGHVLVWGDVSQQEGRLTAWLAGCRSLLGAFREGRDVYSEFGTAAFRTEVSKTINPDLRFLSKETILGSGYGLGKEKFAHYLKVKGKDIDRSVSDKLIDSYRRQYREIPRLWRLLNQSIRKMDQSGYEEEIGPVTITGRKIILPNGMYLDYTSQDLGKLWGGRLLENIIQALGWIQLAGAWREVSNVFKERGQGRVVLPVYDELVCCVPLTDKQWCLDMLGTALVRVPEWAPGLPLACELFSGVRYDKGDCTPISRSSEESL